MAKHEWAIGTLLLSITLICFVSCATIIGKDTQTLTFNSTPSGAILRVFNIRTGNEMINTTTPHTATLKCGSGYFKKAKYRVVVEKEGYNQKEGL